MLRLAHSPRFQPQPQPLGQFTYGQHRLDPLVSAGLQAAGQILARQDPGIPETMNLIERIIVAPGLFPPSVSTGAPSLNKVSDINPYLRMAATSLEHPILVALGVLSIPVIAFMLGRRSLRS